MGNLSKWDRWYSGLDSSNPSSFRFADTVTYSLGAKFLEDCTVVEDWGVGAGGFKRFRPDAIGIDGSNTPFAGKIVDLVEYKSKCNGIFMRHVLDHNLDWARILGNALESAYKVCVVLFIPFNEIGTVEVPGSHDKNARFGVDVTDFSLGRDEFLAVLEEHDVKDYNIVLQGSETVIYITKEDRGGFWENQEAFTVKEKSSRKKSGAGEKNVGD